MSHPREHAPQAEQRPRPVRRALSNLGGPIRTKGHPEACDLLERVWRESSNEDAGRAHVHGFHSYPARFHCELARHLIESIAPPEGTVIDPFCGSGTVLVEARLAGRRALGADLNPIGIMLARLKTRGASKAELDELVEAAAQIRAHADERRLARAGATRGYPPADSSQFEPHVLLELDSLRDGISKLAPGFSYDALRLVLSSILTKVSRKQGDSGDVGQAPRRLAAGFTAKMFFRKTQELASQIADFSSQLPEEPALVRAELDDARSLAWVFESSADLAVSSPPYPGIYDYHTQHATRMRWLGLAGERFSSGEIGARRSMATLGYDEAVRVFRDDMTKVFGALSRALAPSAPAVFVVADSVVDRRPIWIEPLLIACAESMGYRWIATASQERPNFHAPSAESISTRPAL